MEITTIIGIVLAIVIMLLGIRMLFKKPVEAVPSLDANLHIDPDSQTPVIPRHVRSQLAKQEAEVDRILDKIQLSGLDSLTSSERKTLERHSRLKRQQRS